MRHHKERQGAGKAPQNVDGADMNVASGLTCQGWSMIERVLDPSTKAKTAVSVENFAQRWGRWGGGNPCGGGPWHLIATAGGCRGSRNVIGARPGPNQLRRTEGGHGRNRNHIGVVLAYTKGARVWLPEIHYL